MISVLYELIKKNEIEFYHNNKKIDIVINDFGEYGWDLVKHINQQANGHITLKGDGLENFLTNGNNLYELTDFIIQLWWNTTNKIHVDVDIEKINGYYPKKSDEYLINLTKTKKIHTSKWLPQMLKFEKEWNFALCHAMGGAVGYPGYEWPMDENEFEARCAYHAEYFLIGTQDQLKRYEKYYKKFPDHAKEIEKALKMFG